MTVGANKKQVFEHIKNYAISMLARSVWDVTFSETSKPFCHDMAISQIATSLELLIKAKLISIDPSYIFKQESSEIIDWNNENVFLKLKTKSYFELPKILLEKLSISIDIDNYNELGEKRNRAIHLGNLSSENQPEYVLRFVFEFIIPTMFLLDIDTQIFFEYLEEWDEVLLTDSYLVEQISLYNISISDGIKEQLIKYANE